MKVSVKLVIVSLLIIFCGGCVTCQSPRLSISQRVNINHPSPFSMIILGVRPSSSYLQGFLNKLILDFTDTGFFKDVEYIDQLQQSPDLILDVYPLSRHARCMTGEASLMIMTLGIIPLDLGGITGYSFKISNPTKVETLNFQFQYKQKCYMGSLISLLNILPNWSFSQPDEKKHDVNLLKHELILRQKEIKKILISK